MRDEGTSDPTFRRRNNGRGFRSIHVGRQHSGRGWRKPCDGPFADTSTVNDPPWCYSCMQVIGVCQDTSLQRVLQVWFGLLMPSGQHTDAHREVLRTPIGTFLPGLSLSIEMLCCLSLRRVSDRAVGRMLFVFRILFVDPNLPH